MSTFDDFKEGQRVAHISVGDGVVEFVTREFVVVKFDKGKCRGEYNRRWFELHPTYLFHRTSAPASAGGRQ